MPELRGDLQSQPTWRDSLYLRSMERAIHRRYDAARGSGVGRPYADLYAIAANECSRFPNKFTPVSGEVIAVSARADDYRLLCMIHREGVPKVLNHAFLKSLPDLRFEIRADDSYENLPRFLDFLRGFAEEMVVPYFAPSVAVERELLFTGFSAEVETVL